MGRREKKQNQPWSRMAQNFGKEILLPSSFPLFSFLNQRWIRLSVNSEAAENWMPSLWVAICCALSFHLNCQSEYQPQIQSCSLKPPTKPKWPPHFHCPLCLLSLAVLFRSFQMCLFFLWRHLDVALQLSLLLFQQNAGFFVWYYHFRWEVEF